MTYRTRNGIECTGTPVKIGVEKVGNRVFLVEHPLGRVHEAVFGMSVNEAVELCQELHETVSERGNQNAESQT